MKNSYPIISICALAAVFMTAMAIAPGIANLVQYYGVTESMAQLLLTVPPIVAIPVTILTGKMVEHVSKKRLALLGVAIVTISGVVPFFIQSFTIVLILRALMGVGLGILFSITPTLASDFYPAGNKRNLAIGLQGAFSGAGGLIFNYFSGCLVMIDTKMIYLVHLICIVFLVTAVVTMPKVEPQSPTETRGTNGCFDKRCIVFAFVMFFYMCCSMTVNMNVSMFMEETAMGTAVEAGMASLMFSAAAFLTGVFYGSIVKYLHSYTRLAACGITAAGVQLIAVASGREEVYLGAALAGVGLSLFMPSVIAEISATVLPQAISMSVSILMVGNTMAQSFSPILMNPLASALLGDHVRDRFYMTTLVLMLLVAYHMIVIMFGERKLMQQINE